MTKREICERLINIHNRLFHEYAMADGMEDIDLEAIGKDLGALILDLAAPEDEPEPETPKAEEKHPGIIVKADEKRNDGGTEMTNNELERMLYNLAADLDDIIDRVRDLPVEPEPKPEPEPKHPGVIVDPSGKNPPRCLKCGGEAKTHHNLFAAGDEWVMCEKCIAMFRVKPKRGEGEK